MTNVRRAQVNSERYVEGIPPADTSRAHVARIYDAMLGGEAHFPLDAAAAEAAAEPVGGMEAVRYSTRSNRAFLGRAVHWLTVAGIRQFLDLGSGLPTEQNVHEVAQQAAPESRVVYVDFDPVVLAHAHGLMRSTAEGAAAVVIADLRDPITVLKEAAHTLDLTQPTALLMFTILHNVLDSEDPWGIVSHYLDVVPPSSYLALSHLTADFSPEEMARSKEALDERMVEPFVMRGHDDIRRFFEGTQLVDPGLVPINDWHLDLSPSPPEKPSSSIEAPIYGGIGRKP